MSVYDALPSQHESLDGAWSGTIASIPDGNNEVEVLIKAFDNKHRFGPCKYVLGGGEPNRGDECLVVFNEDQRPYVISWWPVGGNGGGGASWKILDAKGDIIVATADDIPSRLPVGTNDQVLVADSTSPNGVKWGSIPAAQVEEWLGGSGAPAGAAGAVGDWYLNYTTGEVLEKTGVSTWTSRANIKGPQGIQGIQGIQGVQGNTGSTGSAGTPGEKWYSGSGAPAGATGIVGDLYLNVTTGEIYEKTGGVSWSLLGSIKGPQGTQGIQGIQGPQGNTGSQGIQGVKGDTGEQGIQGIQGPQGIQGATGQAEVWYSGAGTPPGATGAIGDWYLNTTTGEVHEKTGASTWTSRANIQGPQGLQGPIGPIGTVYDTDQIGTIKAFAGTVIPTNWMLAAGQPMTKTANPQLHTALGIPAGTENYNLPDLQNKFLYGNTAPGVAVGGGSATIALAEAEIPRHRHIVDSHDHGTYAGLTGYFDANHDHAFSGGGATYGGAGTHSHPGAAGVVFGMGVTQTGAVGTGKNVVTGSAGTTGDAGAHEHSVSVSGTTNQTTQNHRHALVAQSPGTSWKGGSGLQSDGPGVAHNNMPPYVLVAFIIKVTGVQVDSGGALVGATGAQGPQGVKGDTGAQGPKGDTGAQGPGGGAITGQTYTITAGYTKDRAINPEATSLTEVARLLGTLIDDMKASGLITP